MTGPGLDLRNVTEADVYIGDQLAAQLRRERRDTISFNYIADERPTEPRIRDRSVSWSLLRSGEYPVITTGGAVQPLFAGLLPEGVRHGVVTSSTKTSADDHLTLLLAIGADTVGNVRVVPAGVEPARPRPMFEPERDSDFAAVFAKLTGSVDADPVGLAGVQPKVSAAMLSVPTRTRSGPAIPEIELVDELLTQRQRRQRRRTPARLPGRRGLATLAVNHRRYVAVTGDRRVPTARARRR